MTKDLKYTYKDPEKAAAFADSLVKAMVSGLNEKVASESTPKAPRTAL